MTRSEQSEKPSPPTQKRPKRKRRRGCFPAILLGLAALLGIYLLMVNPIVTDWRKSQITTDGGAGHLNPAERVYLQFLLTQQVDELFSAAGNQPEATVFEIAPGQGATAIAQNLNANGLLLSLIHI